MCKREDSKDESESRRKKIHQRLQILIFSFSHSPPRFLQSEQAVVAVRPPLRPFFLPPRRPTSQGTSFTTLSTQCRSFLLSFCHSFRFAFRFPIHDYLPSASLLFILGSPYNVIMRSQLRSRHILKMLPPLGSSISASNVILL